MPKGVYYKGQVIGTINNKIDDLKTEYVIFIREEFYKKLKKELESCYALRIIVTDKLPVYTDAMFMTYEQYKRFFEELPYVYPKKITF